MGNPVRMTDPEGADVMTYDALDRLTSVTREENGAAVGVESYAFNALGALKTNAGVALDDQRPRLAGGGTADAAVPATLGGSAVALDGAGRITSVKGITLGWTAAGKLASATPPVPGLRQDFEDDAYRRRVTMYRGGALAEAYVNRGDHRIARLGPSGAVVESTLFDGVDHPLRLKRAGVSTFFELDLAGNVRRLRGVGGADLGGYRYSAFGKTLENTATIDQVLRWKGRPRDVIGGLEIYDMRARTWVPEMGVFLSVDAFGFHDARATLWGWPGQSPIAFRDPTGHHPPEGWELKAEVNGGGYGPSEAATEAYVALHAIPALRALLFIADSGLFIRSDKDLWLTPVLGGLPKSPATPLSEAESGGMCPAEDSFGASSAGAGQRVPRVVQSGGNTISRSAADRLNEYAGTELSRRDWGRALEQLKAEHGLPPNHHGRILDSGVYTDADGNAIDNVLNYLP